RVVVNAVGITMPTELSGFTVNGVNAGAAGNSIAIYVRDSDNDLLITNNDIAPSAGGNGATGMPGTPGGPGAVGGNGIGRLRQACGSAMRAGPAGGATTCSGTSTAGGAGGASIDPRTDDPAPPP